MNINAQVFLEALLPWDECEDYMLLIARGRRIEIIRYNEDMEDLEGQGFVVKYKISLPESIGYWYDLIASYEVEDFITYLDEDYRVFEGCFPEFLAIDKNAEGCYEITCPESSGGQIKLINRNHMLQLAFIYAKTLLRLIIVLPKIIFQSLLVNYFQAVECLEFGIGITESLYYLPPSRKSPAFSISIKESMLYSLISCGERFIKLTIDDGLVNFKAGDVNKMVSISFLGTPTSTSNMTILIPVELLHFLHVNQVFKFTIVIDFNNERVHFASDAIEMVTKLKLELQSEQQGLWGDYIEYACDAGYLAGNANKVYAQHAKYSLFSPVVPSYFQNLLVSLCYKNNKLKFSSDRQEGLLVHSWHLWMALKSLKGEISIFYPIDGYSPLILVYSTENVLYEVYLSTFKELDNDAINLTAVKNENGVTTEIKAPFNFSFFQRKGETVIPNQTHTDLILRSAIQEHKEEIQLDEIDDIREEKDPIEKIIKIMKLVFRLWGLKPLYQNKLK